MNRTFRPYALALATLLAATGIHSAETSLDDIPIAVSNTVKPNVMFTLDDSGSMQFEVIPESTDAYFVFPRPDPLYGDNWGYGSSYSTCVNFDATNKYTRYFRTAAYNKIYYNPAIRYRPWSNADGSLMANATATAAWHNPNIPGEGTRDLTVNQDMTCDFRGDGLGDTTINVYPATYFTYTGGTALTSVDDANNLQANFTKVEIKSANAPFTKAAARTDCAGTTCTYNEEIQNFANWYSYYRSRILASRAGIGRAFARQGAALRVGFGAINKGSTSIDGTNTRTVVKGVRDFTGTARTDWFSSLYGHIMPSEGTPLRRALADVGAYYSRTDDTGPWGQNPGTGGGTQYTCRQNYNILMTDGYWNTGSGAAPSAINDNNIDNTTGSSITSGTPLPPTMTAAQTYQYSPANPYSDSYSGTLADVAMYYWVNDMRSDMLNRVPPNSRDPAFWQHMTTFTVGFGVTGSISSANIASAFTSSPATITWPDPTASDANKVDDLAHAAINGRGGYFSASDPDTFASALTSVLNDVVSRNGAAAAVAVANANVTSGDNASYQSSYNSGTWTGDLVAYGIDLNTGDPITTTPLWTTGTAQEQLETRTSANRYIATYSGAAGVQFQPTSASTTTKVSAAQQTRLNTPTLTDGEGVINFLRGDRTGENNGTYRARSDLLGDIVNAEPVIIREPRFNYTDTGYAAFKTAKATRTKVLVQGANDGMVHIFHASPTTTDADGGKENWAYIPKLLIDMNDPNNSSTSVLNILSRKSGFEHKYLVDATPVQGDVDFSETDGVSGNPAADWRTIVVGGLGKGGRGIYALDLTTPTVSGNTDNDKEASAAAKVLWEFPNSATDATVKANIGQIYGRPIITKTAKGWVVIVASGYNNGTGTNSSGGSGKGYLFILDAKTGALIKAIDTGAGTAADPAGLAHIAGYAENADYNNLVTQVYGGDLLGNVWRFNLTSTNTNSWDAVKLAVLKDASNAVQPITTEPEMASILIGGVYKRFVYVGTGKYLSTTDIGTTQTQTIYGLIDDMSNSPLIADPVRSQLQVQTLTTSGSTRTASNTAPDFSTKEGWYVDLPSSGERINTNPALALGALVFTSNIPNSDACLPGGSSWFNVLDYKTGGLLTNSTVAWSSYSLGNTLGSRPVVIKLPSGAVKALVRKSDASTISVSVPVPSTSTSGKRVSWREVAN